MAPNIFKKIERKKYLLNTIFRKVPSVDFENKIYTQRRGKNSYIIQKNKK